MPYRLRISHARPVAFAFVVALAVLATACQSAAPSSSPAGSNPPPPSGNVIPTRSPLSGVLSTPTKPLDLKGQFAFVSNDGNLSLQDPRTGTLRVLVATGTQGYAQSPAFSPDGRQVAYAYSSFTKDGQVQSQIRTIQLDGSNERVVVSPEDIKLTFDLPAWSPDGKTLYVTQIAPAGQSSQRSEIDRVPASGGALTTVIGDGFEAHLSPDAKKIVFQRVDYNSYASGLWIANADGTNPKQLVESGVFAAIFGAHFAPDGQSIVFAGSGPPKKQLPGAQGLVLPASNEDTCLVAFAFTCWLERAEAHGLPWDLWLVNLDGTRFERLTSIGADSPVPVWSPDGKLIVFYEATGIYALDRETKTISQVSNYGGYGGFDWR